MISASRLRLAAVGHTFSVPLWRGKVREWAKRGEVLAIAPRYWREPLFEVVAEEEKSFRTVPVFFPGRNYGFLYHPSAFALFYRFAPQLLYIEEEPASLAALQFALFARRLGIPYVFVTWENLPVRKRKLSAAAQNFVLSHAAGAICGSEEVAGLLREKGCAAPVLIAPHCAVPEEFFSRDGHAPVEKRLLYCGPLSVEKGVGVLLDAMRMLPADVHLALYGEGPLRQKIVERHKTDPRISWHPPVAPDQVRSLMREASVVVLAPVDVPWQREQFGRIVAEAMASNRPAVVSDTSALARLVNEPSLIARQGDPWSLAAAIRRAFGYGRSEALRRRMQDDYSVPAVSRRIFRFFEELERGGRRVKGETHTLRATP